VLSVMVCRLRLLAALAVVALLATMLAAPAPAQASAGDHEAEFVQRTNAERSSRGVSALRVASDLTDVARRHSATMARQSHLHHNPNLASDVSGWSRIGENVGRGGSVSSLHSALMNSEGHRRNILDNNFSEIGIGVVVSGSTIWVTQVFRLPNGTVSTATTFRDVNGGTHAGNIDRLYKAGVTTGCTSSAYCPTDSVTRAQMATFLTRAMDLTPLRTRLFRDLDPNGVHSANIGALADAGITSGCESGLFCPDRSITRAQMATFLANALDLDTSSSKAQFSDVPAGGVHTGAINAIAKEGITKGCGSGRYCPNQSVTRAEMASFLVRAFDL
jgi:hypothetical protein